ncbi:porin [Moritella sp. 28]|uniref:porin n=1 Tax=Moritella sp. 28 TaxID=2746232 RepID=UPI001BAC2FD7|nr:porin [Moritella sp. 28]QUM85886.1 porin [Moritella sp. 28]
MKKTILATAILLAGAANAAEVYNNEGTSVSLGGSFRGHAVVEDSDNINFEDAGSRFDLKASKEIDEGVKAFGQMEVKYKDVNSVDTLYINNAFVGIEHDVYGKLVLGKKLGLNDDLVMNDFSYEAGAYYHEESAAGAGTEDQLEYTKTFGGASIVVGLIDQDTYALGGTYDVAGLSLGVAYTMKNDVQATVGAKKYDNSSVIVGAQYALDALTVGVQYQTVEVSDIDTTAYGLGAHYQLGQAGVYAMYDIVKVGQANNAKDDKGHDIVVGADYEIVKDVKTYVEFTSKDLDSQVKGSNEAVSIGARVYF